MKKLYTLLMAAAVALSAAAVAPFQPLRQNAASQANLVKFKEYNTKANVAFDAQKLNSALAKAEAELSSRAAEYPSFDRKYMLLSTADMETSIVDAAPCRLYEDPEAPGAGLFFLENFIMPGTNKIECTFDPEVVEGTTFMFLTIPSNTVLFTQDGDDFKLRFFAYDDGVPGVYPDDIQFALMPDGSLYFPYQRGCGIAYVNSQLRGAWIVDPSMPEVNGSYKSEDISGYDQTTGQYQYEVFECDVYGEYSSEHNALMIANFDGFGSVVTGVVDLDAQTATVPVQYITSVRPYQTQNIWAEVHIAGLNNTSVQPLVLNLAAEGNKTRVTADGALLTLPANDQLNELYPNEGWNKVQLYSDLYDIDVTLNIEIPGLTSGIEETVVSDENAPVEYFNLQGVRVENPSNGLYIKRQGNKATKVLVK